MRCCWTGRWPPAGPPPPPPHDAPASPARNTGRARIRPRSVRGPEPARRLGQLPHPPSSPARTAQSGRPTAASWISSAAIQDRASRSSRQFAEQAFGKPRALEILLCVSVTTEIPALRSIPNGGTVRIILADIGHSAPHRRPTACLDDLTSSAGQASQSCSLASPAAGNRTSCISIWTLRIDTPSDIQAPARLPCYLNSMNLPVPGRFPAATGSSLGHVISP